MKNTLLIPQGKFNIVIRVFFQQLINHSNNNIELIIVGYLVMEADGYSTRHPTIINSIKKNYKSNHIFH